MEWPARNFLHGNDKLWFVVSMVFVFPFQEERKLLFSLNYGSIHSLLSQILTVRTGFIPRPHSLGMRLSNAMYMCSSSIFLHVAASSHQTSQSRSECTGKFNILPTCPHLLS